MEHKRRRRTAAWVGPWLREHRTETPDAIAAKLGVGRSSVSRMESGVSSIPADDLPIVLKVYGLSARRFAAEADRRAA